MSPRPAEAPRNRFESALRLAREGRFADAMASVGHEGFGSGTDGEAAAAIVVADRDVTPVGLDDPARDSQAEPGRAIGPGSPGELAPECGFEDAREIRFGDAAALIGHSHVRAFVVDTGLDPHRAIHRRETDRVLEKVT